ncbi:endonuclease/exonuclease/phosphatase family protein [Streptomyces zhihengii]
MAQSSFPLAPARPHPRAHPSGPAGNSARSGPGRPGPPGIRRHAPASRRPGRVRAQRSRRDRRPQDRGQGTGGRGPGPRGRRHRPDRRERAAGPRPGIRRTGPGRSRPGRRERDGSGERSGPPSDLAGPAGGGRAATAGTRPGPRLARGPAARPADGRRGLPRGGHRRDHPRDPAPRLPALAPRPRRARAAARPAGAPAAAGGLGGDRARGHRLVCPALRQRPGRPAARPGRGAGRRPHVERAVRPGDRRADRDRAQERPGIVFAQECPSACVAALARSCPAPTTRTGSPRAARVPPGPRCSAGTRWNRPAPGLGARDARRDGRRRGHRGAPSARASAASGALRDRRLATGAGRAGRLGRRPPGGPALIAGDFNATGDHAAFRRILDRGRLRDAAALAGAGRTPSWPARLPRPLGAQIDHVLVGEAFSVRSARFLDLPGTDHRALLVSSNCTPRADEPHDVRRRGRRVRVRRRNDRGRPVGRHGGCVLSRSAPTAPSPNSSSCPNPSPARARSS